jgi:hypothetical protein
MAISIANGFGIQLPNEIRDKSAIADATFQRKVAHLQKVVHLFPRFFGGQPSSGLFDK